MTPEEIINKINNSGHYEYSLELLIEFGKNCFEASRESSSVSYWNNKYENYEDYLKQLYENKN